MLANWRRRQSAVLTLRHPLNLQMSYEHLSLPNFNLYEKANLPQATLIRPRLKMFASHLPKC